MPIATSLPSKNVVIRFPPSAPPDEAEEESYQLLELPAEILKQVEGEKGQTVHLTIKGRPSDDAVLCTPSTTFLLRTVQISNSLLVLRPPPDTSSHSPSSSKDIRNIAHRPTLQIRDTCHQVLECVPHPADLERIRRVLRDSQWEGMDSELESVGRRGKRKWGLATGAGKRKKGYTREMLESVVQGSEEELSRGLRERNVVQVDGKMLLLPLRHLLPLLSLLFPLLTIHSISTDLAGNPAFALAPAQVLITVLQEDHDVRPELTRGVMGLFGDMEGDEWRCRVRDVVREVGKGMLEGMGGEGMNLDVFLGEWREAVGEGWRELVDLRLLEGECLLNDPPPSAIATPSRTIVPFPAHALPLHPPTRFADLFLTRARWRPEDMAPFLKGLTREGDTKERDKLVAKFVRVVKEKEGTWCYPRRTS